MSTNTEPVFAAEVRPTPAGLVSGIARRYAEKAAIGSTSRDDIKRQFSDIACRLDALALLDQAADHGTTSRPAINLATYLCDVGHLVISSLAADARVSFEPPSPTACLIAAREAGLLGLITVDLVSNAVLYAHPASVPGRIRIGCERAPDGGLVMEVADDGVGLPEGMDAATSDSVGFRSMRLLCAQLGGDLSFVSSCLLVGIEDVTDRRRLEQQQEDLLRQKDLLLKEMSHRISNSLQIIASILLLKAQSVTSTETRRHLEEAHERVVAIAKVQNHLQPLPFGAAIDVKRYLTGLAESLAESMIDDNRAITLRTEVDAGTLSSEEAVSVGLIVTELIINALKHAFPDDRGGEVTVRYQVGEANWRLSVSDNGKGMQRDLTEAPVRTGLGTSIVEALARQLGGRVQIAADSPGTTVSVTGPNR